MNTESLAELLPLPDTTAGNSARRLVWSLWNQHYTVNLYEHIGNLPLPARVEFGALIAGNIEDSEPYLRRLMTQTGEFDRIDTHPLN